MIEARCVNSNLRLPPDSGEVKGTIAEVPESLSGDLPLGRRRISAGLSHFYVERCRAVYPDPFVKEIGGLLMPVSFPMCIHCSYDLRHGCFFCREFEKEENT